MITDVQITHKCGCVTHTGTRNRNVLNHAECALEALEHQSLVEIGEMAVAAIVLSAGRRQIEKIVHCRATSADRVQTTQGTRVHAGTGRKMGSVEINGSYLSATRPVRRASSARTSIAGAHHGQIVGFAHTPRFYAAVQSPAVFVHHSNQTFPKAPEKLILKFTEPQTLANSGHPYNP